MFLYSRYRVWFYWWDCEGCEVDVFGMGFFLFGRVCGEYRFYWGVFIWEFFRVYILFGDKFWIVDNLEFWISGNKSECDSIRWMDFS